MKLTFRYILLITLILICNYSSALVVFLDGTGRMQYLDLESRKIIPHFFHNNQKQNFQSLQSSTYFQKYDSSYWNNVHWFLGDNYINSVYAEADIYHIFKDKIKRTGKKQIQLLDVFPHKDTSEIGYGTYSDTLLILNETDSLRRKFLQAQSLVTKDSWTPLKHMTPIEPYFLMRLYHSGKMTLSSFADFEHETMVVEGFHDDILKTYADKDLYILTSKALYRLSYLLQKLELLVEVQDGFRFKDMAFAKNEIYLFTDNNAISCIDRRNKQLISIVNIEENIRHMGLDDYVYVVCEKSIYCFEERTLRVSHKISINNGISSRVIPVY